MKSEIFSSYQEEFDSSIHWNLKKQICFVLHIVRVSEGAYCENNFAKRCNLDVWHGSEHTDDDKLY